MLRILLFCLLLQGLVPFLAGQVTNLRTGAGFSSFALAISAAASGDTLRANPGYSEAVPCTVTVPVVLVGGANVRASKFILAAQPVAIINIAVGHILVSDGGQIQQAIDALAANAHPGGSTRPDTLSLYSASGVLAQSISINAPLELIAVSPVIINTLRMNIRGGGSLTIRQNNHLTIRDSLVLPSARGIIQTTKQAYFNLLAGCKVITAFRSSAFVNGPMAWRVSGSSSELVYPIGRGSVVRPVILRNVSFTGDLVMQIDTVRITRQIPDNLIGTSTQRQYACWSPTGNVSINADIELLNLGGYAVDGDAAASAKPYHLRLAIDTGNNTSAFWQSLGGTMDTLSVFRARWSGRVDTLSLAWFIPLQILDNANNDIGRKREVCFRDSLVLKSIANGTWTNRDTTVLPNPTGASASVKFYFNNPDTVIRYENIYLSRGDSVDTLTVEILPRLIIKSQRYDSVCVGTRKRFDARVIGDWGIRRGSSWVKIYFDSLYIEHLFDTPGSERVIYFSNGRSCPDTIYMTIFALPTARLQLPVSDTVCNAVDSIILSGGTGNGNIGLYTTDTHPNIDSITPIKALYVSGKQGWQKVYYFNVAANSGCYKRAVDSVYLQAPLPADSITISAEDTTAFCRGGGVWLQTPPRKEVYYQWRLNGVPVGTNAPRYFATVTGTYSLTLRNQCGSVDAVNTIDVTLFTPPTAPIISGPDTLSICRGDSVRLTVTPQPGVRYQWNRDGQAIIGANNPFLIATESGVYSVSLSNICGIAPSLNNIVVRYAPAPPAPTTVSARVCAGQPATLTATATTTGTIEWYDEPSGGNLIATGNQLLIGSASERKVYYAQLRPADANSCPGARTAAYLEIDPLPPAVTITATGALNFCAGGSVTIAAPLYPGLSYRWRRGTIPTGTGKDTIIVTETGAYSLILENNCGSTPSVNTLTALAVPLPPIPVITRSGDTLISGSSTGNRWQLNGVQIPGATQQRYLATIAGNYTVSVTVTTSGVSCTQTSAPYTFTPGVFRLDSWEDEVSIQLFPNPATDEINFAYTGSVIPAAPFLVSIYDFSGRMVAGEKRLFEAVAVPVRWDISHLKAGRYVCVFVNINTGEISKIIFEKH